jgi:hypothetical protein
VRPYATAGAAAAEAAEAREISSPDGRPFLSWPETAGRGGGGSGGPAAVFGDGALCEHVALPWGAPAPAVAPSGSAELVFRPAGGF